MRETRRDAGHAAGHAAGHPERDGVRRPRLGHPRPARARLPRRPADVGAGRRGAAVGVARRHLRRPRGRPVERTGRAGGVPHLAARRGPDRRPRRHRPRRSAGAPRRPRLGIGRRLGRAGRRDVGPAARGSRGVVHLGERSVARPPRRRELDLARPAAAAAAGAAQLVRVAVPGPVAPRARLGTAPVTPASAARAPRPDHRGPAVGPRPAPEHPAHDRPLPRQRHPPAPRAGALAHLGAGAAAAWPPATSGSRRAHWRVSRPAAGT